MPAGKNVQKIARRVEIIGSYDIFPEGFLQQFTVLREALLGDK